MLACAAVLVAALGGEVGPAAPAEAAPPPTPPASAREEYENRKIGFDLIPVVSGTHGNVTTGLATVPWQGQYKRPLDQIEFYRIVGRNDLAAEYQARSARRNVLMGIGLAGLLGGAVYVGANWSQAGPDVNAPPDVFRQQMERQDRRTREVLATGSLISAGGALFLLAAVLTNPSPIDDVEGRRLADEYNRRLRKELGASEASPAPEGPAPERPGFSLGAAPLPGGAVAGVALTF